MSSSHAAPAGGTPGWVRWTTTVAAVAVLVAALAFWWYREHRQGIELKAQFKEAVGVYPGSDVRMLGVAVGTIDSVHPDGEWVTVDMHLDPGVKVASDTSAVIVSPNLVSDRYIQLTGVYTSGPQLTSGTTIGHAHTATPVELDTLYQNLIDLTGALGPNGANKSGALSDLIDTAAKNLKGNGTYFNTTVKNLADAASTFDNSKDDLFLTVQHLSSFTGMLAQNNDSLVTVNQELASVTQTLANDRASFGAAIKDLGSALDLVQKFIRDNRSAISTDVAKLDTTASTLAGERANLLKSLKAAPLLVQNLINAYDPNTKLLDGRADLNELSIWAKQSASDDGPPTFLHGAGSR